MLFRQFLGIVSAILLVATLNAPVGAVSLGGGSVQGYAAEAAISPGTVVKLDKKAGGVVQIVSQKQLQNMYGVVVDKADLPVTITNSGLKNETFVATSGTYNTLVNTQNGSIKTGDYVTLSSVDGVLMKAGTKDEQSTVFGRAQADFDGTGLVLSKTTLKDTNGKDNKEIALGSIPVTVNIQRNPVDKSTKINAPEFLQRIGKAIAEKEVSAIRIYISMGITAVSLVTALVVLYSGVRSSVISIGRNPMSKRSILRALLQIILTSLIILVVGLFAVYLLLKL